MKSILFGVGPAKNNYPIEIQLGYYLSSWGIIGTIVFVLIESETTGISHVTATIYKNIIRAITIGIIIVFFKADIFENTKKYNRVTIKGFVYKQILNSKSFVVDISPNCWDEYSYN
mgnify:CR=1 FL=1